MTTPRTVNYNGQQLTLKQLAKASGLSYSCICRRWYYGDRGPELWRPLDGVGGNSGPRQEASLRGEGVTAKARDEDAAKREVLRARKEQRAARIAAIKAAHAAEFGRPFIDAALLTTVDRAANANRIKYCGQRSWRMKAESV